MDSKKEGKAAGIRRASSAKSRSSSDSVPVLPQRVESPQAISLFSSAQGSDIVQRLGAAELHKSMPVIKPVTPERSPTPTSPLVTSSSRGRIGSCSSSPTLSTPVIEREDKPDMIYERDAGGCRLAYASARRLIEAITPTDVPDELTLTGTVLTTFRSFCTRTEFWELLRARHDVLELSEDDRMRVRTRFYGVLKRWLAQGYDFDDLPLLRSVDEFVRKYIEPVSPGTSQILLSSIAELKSSIWGSDPPEPSEHCPRALITAERWTPRQVFTQPPLEMARQITLRESQLFCAVLPPELQRRAWMSSEKESVAPNVLAAIHSFNQINSWALEEILTAPALSVRTATLEFFLRLLLELRELNNFSGMLALLAALDSNPISRLKDMWAGVPSKLKKHYEELVPLLNPMQNSRALREVQTAARYRNSPCVPHLGYYLSALYFADEGNPDQKVILPQDVAVTPLINVRRCRLMAGLLDELRAFQKLPKYDLIPLPFVDEYLRTIEVRVPSRWEELSTLILPRPDHSPVPPPLSPKPLHGSSPLATDGGSASLNTSNSSLNSTSSV